MTITLALCNHNNYEKSILNVTKVSFLKTICFSIKKLSIIAISLKATNLSFVLKKSRNYPIFSIYMNKLQRFIYFV